jgi:exodeoxyribonuclease V alpha subunit
VQALAPATRLLLVGDRDQLASVEAGSVLGDICPRGPSLGFSAHFSARLASLTGYRPDAVFQGQPGSGGAGRLADSIVVLRRSYRFDDRGGIGRLARRVNAGDVDGVFESLADPADACVRRQALESDAAGRAWLAKQAVKGYREYLSTQEPHPAIARFDRFKILCVLRGGTFGVDAVNAVARRALAGAGLLVPELAGAGPWYAGRPVLITRNDYESGLFNGDMGVTLPDPESADRLRVFFRDPDGDPRPFDPLQLPAHETVFAMTVHKSQGSEFDDVLLVLPQRDTPLLTRELVYTAVTRARRSVTILGRGEVLSAALGRTVDRASGLRERLWGMDSKVQEGMQ